MAIDVSCPQCSAAYQVQDDKAGKKFRCKQCQEIITIPGGGSTSTGDDPWGTLPAAPPRNRPSSSGRDEDEVPNPLSGRRSSRKNDRDREDDRDDGGSRRRRRRSSGSGVNTVAPAIAIYIVTVLSIAWWLFYMFVVVSDPAGIPADEQESYIAVNLVHGGLQLLGNGLILFGAFQLQTRQSKGLAMLGAILCCIPLCSPCMVLGIPFGIWALVVINSEGTFNS